MKSLSLYALAAAAVMAFAPAAMADGIAVGVVNIQQVMSDSTAAKSVREQLEAKQKAFQAEISKKEEQLQKEDQELGKQRSVLSKDAFAEKARVFSKKVTDGQKEAQSKKALLDSAFERSLGEIQKSVTQIITDIAKEKNLTLVIPTSQLLFADPKLDVSSDVLTRLNQKLPKVEVKFDAPEKADSDKK